MAGGHMKYRHLSRSSSHRQALLRNLVTSLFKHETIATTWHKAKEAQRLAEKLVTLGKKNTEATRRRATQIFFEPNEMVPKLFGPIRKRYEERPGGYTRILRIEPMKEDQAESAILELVDGPKDMRFAMTAKTLANRHPELGFTPGITTHVKKVTRYRKGGMRSLRQMVERMRIEKQDMDDRILAAPKKVYPEEHMQRNMHYFEDVDPGKLPNRVAPKKMSTYREQKARQRMRGQMSTRAKKIVPKKKDRQMLKGDRPAVAGVPKAGVERKTLKSGRPVVAGRQKASGEKKVLRGGRPAVAGGQKAGGDKKKKKQVA